MKTSDDKASQCSQRGYKHQCFSRVTRTWKRERLWDGKIRSTETEMMTVINIVNCILREATVCASRQNCWLSATWRGGRREAKKKEVYSYKLPNGNFSHILLAWQKCLGCLMAALFTAQQAASFPSYEFF